MRVCVCVCGCAWVAVWMFHVLSCVRLRTLCTFVNQPCTIVSLLFVCVFVFFFFLCVYVSEGLRVCVCVCGHLRSNIAHGVGDCLTEHWTLGYPPQPLFEPLASVRRRRGIG